MDIENKENIAMNNNAPVSKPYMGDLTSEQIGSMARAGELGGEMVRRMIKYQENQLLNQYNKDQLK